MKKKAPDTESAYNSTATSSPNTASDTPIYFSSPSRNADNEPHNVGYYTLREINSNIQTIKGCVVFFTSIFVVAAVIGIVLLFGK